MDGGLDGPPVQMSQPVHISLAQLADDHTHQEAHLGGCHVLETNSSCASAATPQINKAMRSPYICPPRPCPSQASCLCSVLSRLTLQYQVIPIRVPIIPTGTRTWVTWVRSQWYSTLSQRDLRYRTWYTYSVGRYGTSIKGTCTHDKGI